MTETLRSDPLSSVSQTNEKIRIFQGLRYHVDHTVSNINIHKMCIQYIKKRNNVHMLFTYIVEIHHIQRKKLVSQARTYL